MHIVTVKTKIHTFLYVKTLRVLENAPILLASLTYSWSIDNWEQFLNIINEKFVEQPFIPLLLKIKHKKLRKKNMYYHSFKISIGLHSSHKDKSICLSTKF